MIATAKRKETKRRMRGRARAEEVVIEGPTSAAPPKLSAGVKLVRVFKGKRHVVTTMEKGFEWNGTLYRSLSAVATAISGQHCSGPAFFGLRARKESSK